VPHSLNILMCVAVLAAGAAAGQAEESIEPQCLTNVRQVTSGFVKAGEGYFSPDAKTIIYQAIRVEYPFYQIYKQPLAGGEPQLVSRGRGRTTCAYFAPCGTKLLFASGHTDPNLTENETRERQQQEEDRRTGRRRRYNWFFDPHMEIYEADLQGRNLKPLTAVEGYDAEGAYSADGRRIAFCSDRDGDPDIFIMNADGSDVRQLTDEPGYDGGPFISPDGRWVVFRSDRKHEGQLQLFAISVEGQHETPLTDEEHSVNWGPYWHPTAPYVIWARALHADPRVRPNYDLWLMRYRVDDGRIAPGRRWRITDHAAADVLPVFSPDGTKLMWTSTRTADRTSQLWIADFQLPKDDE